jgi:NhaC family Na+:H+ antiporter
MSAVLGVPVLTYLPYAFFNVIHPILAVLYGYIGFRVVCTPLSPSESGEAKQAIERAGV